MCWEHYQCDFISMEFITSQKRLFYCGGKEEMSYIDRDKVSLPEICAT